MRRESHTERRADLDDSDKKSLFIFLIHSTTDGSNGPAQLHIHLGGGGGEGGGRVKGEGLI